MSQRLTGEQVLERAREHGVSFVRLQFTDILGTVKNVSITAPRLKEALEGNIMFDVQPG